MAAPRNGADHEWAAPVALAVQGRFPPHVFSANRDEGQYDPDHGTEGRWVPSLAGRRCV